MTRLEMDVIYWLSVLGVVLGGSILLSYAIYALRLWREKRRQKRALRMKIDAWALNRMALEQLEARERKDRYFSADSMPAIAEGRFTRAG